MSKEIGLYKEFIDELVSRSDSVGSEWVLRGAYPDTDDNKERNEFLASLSDSQKAELAKMLQEEKESGVHASLVLLSEECSISFKGKPLPGEPFDTELFFDYIARIAGDDWPK